MWIIIGLALLVAGLCIIIIQPRNIRQNREDSYRAYREWERAYREDKKYYKIFRRGRKEEESGE